MLPRYGLPVVMIGYFIVLVYSYNLVFIVYMFIAYSLSRLSQCSSVLIGHMEKRLVEAVHLRLVNNHHQGHLFKSVECNGMDKKTILSRSQNTMRKTHNRPSFDYGTKWKQENRSCLQSSRGEQIPAIQTCNHLAKMYPCM